MSTVSPQIFIKNKGVQMKLFEFTRLLVPVILFLTASVTSELSAEMHYNDDGITPYKQTEFLTQYLQSVPKEYLKYFKCNPEALNKWENAKFGVFMHWDPSCQITGAISWKRKGPRPHHASDGKVTKGIPEDVYNSQYKTFNPVKFDADKWVKMVKDSGAKYLVFTAKHHNGFCMFDTPTTDYCIRNTPFKRDICKELADACHKYGIMLFWYYSQPDWTEPSYRLDFKSDEFYQKYIKNYLYPQLKQLLTKYGKVDGIWFDGLGLPPTVWHTPEMLKMLRTINPDLIVNHRFSFKEMHIGDFDGPENHLGRFQINRPWETCFILGGGWGYKKEASPLSQKDAIGLLVRCACNGGNLLLNTGPSPEGTIHESHIQRYREMGEWLEKYGESIYSTRGGPYMPGTWGGSTRSSKGNNVYLHILADWNGQLTLPNLEAKILSAECITIPGQKVTVSQDSGKLKIELADFDSSAKPIDTIIKLTLDKPAMSIPVVKSVGDSLTIGCEVKASSCGISRRKMTTPDALIAKEATEFFDGAYIRSVWKSDSKDKKPWLEFKFKAPVTITQITMNEGRVGRPSSVQAFSIYLKKNGEWEKIYSGTEIGSTFGLVLDKPIKTDAMKIEFDKFRNNVSLNAVDVY